MITKDEVLTAMMNAEETAFYFLSRNPNDEDAKEIHEEMKNLLYRFAVKYGFVDPNKTK